MSHPCVGRIIFLLATVTCLAVAQGVHSATRSLDSRSVGSHLIAGTRMGGQSKFWQSDTCHRTEEV